MKIASWNVNSIRTRLETLLDWLGAESPDVMCLQETKVVDGAFPGEELAAAGYWAVANGQKTYNGVATLVRSAGGEPEVVARELPGDDDDEQRRFLDLKAAGLRVLNVYVPNGSAVGSDKYDYKLAWYRRLLQYLREEADPAEPLAICGDFNVAPEDRDVWNAEQVEGQVMFSEEERDAFGALLEWGLVDSLRLHHPDEGLYTWWDYRQGAFRRNLGWRIDFILVTRPLADRCREAGIDRWPRQQPKPSDHTPIFAVLQD